jgi:hypothetical protein
MSLATPDSAWLLNQRLRYLISGEQLLAQLERFSHCCMADATREMLGEVLNRSSKRKVFETNVRLGPSMIRPVLFVLVCLGDSTSLVFQVFFGFCCTEASVSRPHPRA